MRHLRVKLAIGPAGATWRAAVVAAAVVAVLLGAPVEAQGTFKAPESIKIGLATMNQVVTDTARLIAAHSFDQLPRESDRFEAGVEALQQGVGDAPSPLRKQIEPLIGRARIAASAMAEAARSHRTAMLPIAHDQLASAVSSLVALFPPELRPAPPPG
ncbi:MAG TPA: hypothetical protein VMD03_01910 [Steroidobacteraceae bacterium]|nr:hypothetical protein [Steroidobacteraceae bacterium]